MKTKFYKVISLLLVVVISLASVPFAYAADSLDVAAVYGDTLDKVTLPDGFSWSVENPENVGVGNVGENSFKASRTVDSTIEEIDVIVTVSPAYIQEIEILTDGGNYYTGDPIEPTVNCRFKGTELLKGTDYTVTYEDNTSVGKAKVIVEGIGNFMGKSEFDFYIIKTDVEGVYLNCNEIEVPPGMEFNLSATIYPSNATFKNVIWSSSDDEIVSVDENGKVKAVANGTGTITATTVDGNFIDECVVNVVTHVEKIDITVGSVKMAKEETYILNAMLFPWDVNDQLIHWSSSDESVAVVDENGVVTAVADGEAVITATTNDGGFTDTCLITVDTPIMGLDIPESLVLVRYKNTVDLDLNVSIGIPNDTEIIWSSSNEKVAEVDENGTVIPKKVGITTITVETADGKYSDTCNVKVYYTWWQWLIKIVLFGWIWY